MSRVKVSTLIEEMVNTAANRKTWKEKSRNLFLIPYTRIYRNVARKLGPRCIKWKRGLRGPMVVPGTESPYFEAIKKEIIKWELVAIEGNYGFYEMCELMPKVLTCTKIKRSN